MNAHQTDEWLDKARSLRETNAHKWESAARIADGIHKANHYLYNAERTLHSTWAKHWNRVMNWDL